MNVIEVKSPEQIRAFLNFPVQLYKGDKSYIQPLDKDIEFVFDRAKNKFFSHGDCVRWLLEENGNVIGRVAAFINERTANTFDQPTGGMGFFECINNQEAANLLFDTCKNWLQERGMEAMDGPINFGERNKWWGLLIDGFEEPIYCMNYNPPWYRELFENYGFREYFQQYSYGLPVNQERPKHFYEKSKDILSDPNYHFIHVSKNNLRKFALDFRVIFNKAWAKHSGFKEMTETQAMKILEAAKPILVDYLIWFGYFKNEPIAVFFMLPDINQYFKYVNGNLNWWGKIKFLYHKLKGTNRKIFGAVFGVVPEFQGKGVEGAIILAANEVVVPKMRWDTIELTWIGDFNPKMMKVASNLGAQIVKTHVTYRKLFDETKPFSRAPIID